MGRIETIPSLGIAIMQHKVETRLWAMDVGKILIVRDPSYSADECEVP